MSKLTLDHAENLCAPAEEIVSAGESVESNSQELVEENCSTTEAMVVISWRSGKQSL